MIQDGFPKAKHHALVIARDPLLRSIANLSKEHLPLLAHMEQVARKWVEDTHSKVRSKLRGFCNYSRKTGQRVILFRRTQGPQSSS